MTPDQIGFAFIILGFFLIIGKWIRVFSPLLQQLFLPSSIIAGLLALLAGPEVLGAIAETVFSADHALAEGLIPPNVIEVWSALPGLLISIVFASLFLGTTLPSLKKVWFTGGPQVAMGQMVSWGQYVIGILLVLLILTPFFGTNPLAGALIEISFVGGHGTAAGLGDTFADLGFAEGQDLAVGLATIGILGGVIIGIILINWGARTGRAPYVGGKATFSSKGRNGIVELNNRYSSGEMTTRPESVDPLSLHFAYVGLAIGIGWVLLEALVWLEDATYGGQTDVYLFEYVPLFPLAMVGGIIVQGFSDKFDKFRVIDKGMIDRIGGFSLDVLIVSALATISVSVIGENIVAFLSLAAVGVAWNVIAFLFLAPKMIPAYWFERGIGDFGQATGIAATGLLLMKVADPETDTPAFEGFGYKQVLFEPFVGGGLVTAASMPLIFQFGAVPFFIGALVITLFWMIFGMLYFGRK
ncbi:sodium/glutamate symporter [Salisediminibacterium halotolerans]|uniref:sodium/glutamate symporter n=1 Tax=Salisediminibacterium halotolerans TaxID=517425 RepID=UPI000EADAA6C|nr:sodium/glutamate symporter [Salisediminibacterium halotolerans]RLJ71750.1 ESS family glutamate:Na+ symporter [Actinophytocola xinjiangensis]RPE86900.1 ESS family glutamate:Na+ symporter [Salisediminibacterium halotolerans]TWG32963.1 ESS family glutamate:Na+ symporter [Salisediminibacterium halotolerans]GEL08653.1 sodium:glutamate symporter [Salisediminibacterium halotolerans]